MVSTYEPGPTTVDHRGDRAPMSPIVALLERLRLRYADLRDGHVATSIPELARVAPDRFAIALATVDGALYAVGNADVPFTIQSMSKPLTYAAALEAVGEAAVRQRIGVEPTGDAFNAITLSAVTGMPLNPMVNAGAIAATGLVPESGAQGDDGAGGAARDPLFALYDRFAGRSLGIDASVQRSESETGHRNRAIAHLLKGTGALDGDPDAVVERYLRCCSVEVDVRDLAVMAATLAAGGRNPRTGERAASEASVRSVLSVMATCGMYDGAGEWFHTVGLPAKSGVSGGILAVLPGRLGIAVWSPRLDERGNSVRGLAVFRDLSRGLGLHLVAAARQHVDPVRTRTTVAQRHSKRIRSAADQAGLVAGGGDCLLLELQGDLDFAPVEAVVRSVLEARTPHAVVLDLQRVDRIDVRVASLLVDLALTLGGSEQPALAWSGGARHAVALDEIDARLLAAGALPCPRFGELDAAIEWCEDGILGERRAAPPVLSVELADHQVVRGLAPAVIARLERVMRHRTWVAGEIVVRRGTPTRELILITRGELSVTVPVGADRGMKRLSTLTAGMVLGELAFLGSETRTADVVADTLVEAWVLDSDALADLATDDVALQAAILTNLLRIVAGMADRMTREIALLAG